jgi:lysophospholipase L1-like esterase
MNQQDIRGPFKKLVVLGESTVAGGGWVSNPEERWADVLWKLLEEAQEEPITYLNAGIGASVISPNSPGYEPSAKPSASERLQEAVIAPDPDLVAIAYGLNDMRAGMPLKDFRADMQDLIDRIRDSIDPMIVIVNVYHMTEYDLYPFWDKGDLEVTVEYNSMLTECAETNDCVYADVWNAQGTRDYVVHQDGIHANKIGNMLIAHKVFEAIVHAAPGIADTIIEKHADTDWSRTVLKIQKPAGGG